MREQIMNMTTAQVKQLIMSNTKEYVVIWNHGTLYNDETGSSKLTLAEICKELIDLNGGDQIELWDKFDLFKNCESFSYSGEDEITVDVHDLVYVLSHNLGSHELYCDNLVERGDEYVNVRLNMLDLD